MQKKKNGVFNLTSEPVHKIFGMHEKTIRITKENCSVILADKAEPCLNPAFNSLIEGLENLIAFD